MGLWGLWHAKQRADHFSPLRIPRLQLCNQPATLLCHYYLARHLRLAPAAPILLAPLHARLSGLPRGWLRLVRRGPFSTAPLSAARPFGDEEAARAGRPHCAHAPRASDFIEIISRTGCTHPEGLRCFLRLKLTLCLQLSRPHHIVEAPRLRHAPAPDVVLAAPRAAGEYLAQLGP